MKMNGVPVEGYSRPLCWRMDPDHSYSDWTIEVVRCGEDWKDAECPAKIKTDANSGVDAMSLSARDSTFSSEGRIDTYHVHRASLAIGPHRSAYFLGMFRQTIMKEFGERKSRICLTEHEADALPRVLDCLYQGPEYFKKIQRGVGMPETENDSENENENENEEDFESIPSSQIHGMMTLFDYFCMPDLKEKLMEYMENTSVERVSAEEIPDLMSGLDTDNVILQNWCLKKLHKLAFDAETRGKQEDHQILIASTRRMHKIVEFALERPREKISREGGSDSMDDTEEGESTREEGGDKSRKLSEEEEMENKQREVLNERRKKSQSFLEGTSPAFLATKNIIPLLVLGIEQSRDCEENLLFVMRIIERICQSSDEDRDKLLEAKIMAPISFLLQSTSDVSFSLREKVASVYKILFATKHRRPKLDLLLPAFPGAWSLMFSDEVFCCVSAAARHAVSTICDRPKAERQRLIDLGLCSKIGELILDPPEVPMSSELIPVTMPQKAIVKKKTKLPKKEMETKGYFFGVEEHSTADKVAMLLALEDFGCDADGSIDGDLEVCDCNETENADRSSVPRVQNGPLTDSEIESISSILMDYGTTSLGDNARKVALYLANHEESDPGTVFSFFMDQFIPSTISFLNPSKKSVTLTQFVQWMSLVSQRGTEVDFREYMGHLRSRVVKYLMLGVDRLREGDDMEKRNTVAMSLNILVRMLAIDAEDHKGSRKRKWRVHTLMKEQSRADLAELEDLVKMTDHADLAQCSAAILKKYFRRSRGVKRKRSASARPIRAVMNDDFDIYFDEW